MNPNKSETNRYNNGKIYKIIDMINDFYYIGSTTSTLARRLYEHKQNITRIQSRKVYNYFNEIGFDNIKIILIKEVNVDNKNQLLKAENDIIEECLKDEKCLNSIRSWTGILRSNNDEYYKLYYQKYKDEVSERHKKYNKENKQHINENKKQYYENKKEQILEQKKIYYMNNKDKLIKKHQTYYEENKEISIKAHRIYYDKNKETISQYKSEKIQCTCGCFIRRDGMKEHQITKKHKTFIQNQQQESEAI